MTSDMTIDLWVVYARPASPMVQSNFLDLRDEQVQKILLLLFMIENNELLIFNKHHSRVVRAEDSKSPL